MNNNNQRLYLDDYSTEDIIDLLKLAKYNEEEIKEEKNETKPSFIIKPNYNSKGEKIVIFSINIPLKKNGLKIDILINGDMYKDISKYFI